MLATVVDTGVLIGAADTSDHHHNAALEIVYAIDGGELPTARITNYVLLESLNWIHERQRHSTPLTTPLADALSGPRNL